jgi:hypothetical protein
MQYTVIYDVTQAGYRQWWFPAIGVAFITVGALLFRYRRSLPKGPAFVPYFFLGFSILWTLITFVPTYTDYRRLSSALRDSRCDLVEGVLTNLRRMPSTGPQKAESFTVGNQYFEYSDYVVTAGYNQMQSHGGILRESDRVRIYYYHKDIARLEIAR